MADSTDIVSLESFGSSLASSVTSLATSSLIWGSIGLAVMQLVMIARHLIWAGTSPLQWIFPNYESPLGYPFPEDGKDQLFGNNVRTFMELTYWIIKFTDDYDKAWAKSGVAARNDDIGDLNVEDDIGDLNVEDDKSRTFSPEEKGKNKFFSKNATGMFKLMRYVTKFVGNYDKLYKRFLKG